MKASAVDGEVSGSRASDSCTLRKVLPDRMLSDMWLHFYNGKISWVFLDYAF